MYEIVLSVITYITGITYHR